MVVTDKSTRVVIETRGPRSHDPAQAYFVSNGAIEQLSIRLRLSGLKDGVIFFYPSAATEIPIVGTGSSEWPQDLNLCEVFGADPSEYPDDDEVEPTPLVDE
ncbi:hypothetical protein [Pseudomonas sp.]|uniref:hypothetical protein n=1 Tax=Pseudomonas sp. TaxID=306 RepID=UPI00260A42E1|nr:hypothetical protein [Pseudomonas sp.]